MSSAHLSELVIGIKGAGEMASGIAWRLYMANLKKIFMMDVHAPLAVRRDVSFCEALLDGRQIVEGVEAVKAANFQEVDALWNDGAIAVLADPEWHATEALCPDVVIDAILAKKNLGTTTEEAALVVGLGPGFTAGEDVHLVIETNRGHNLGRIIQAGCAEPNTGIPGSIGGHAANRVLRAPKSGIFKSDRTIGEITSKGEVIGAVDNEEVVAEIDGVIRGLIRPNISVTKGLKIGDIDPRKTVEYCRTISEKARAIGGSILEAIMRVYNRS
ncbi:MAG: EF2563 family selenium-dependent molybdenum hydroxylase system protein [Proteobacteria bacterium]|nr:EF2563 family selenium-dependent molybdenum hydroxylase system protein [Pseudomonadota bacterium]